MENPANWDMLTSGLAVCDLQKPDKVWAFLALQGLVRDLPGDRDFFYGIIHRERAVGEMTGPSLQSRIAGQLRELGITLSQSEELDPHAQIAKKRLESLNNLMKDKESFQAIRHSLFCTHCGVEADKRPAVCSACGKAFHDFSETCIKSCERCKTLNPMLARFCCSCGNSFVDSNGSIAVVAQAPSRPFSAAPLSAARNDFEQSRRFCSYCGGLNNSNYKFCRICGRADGDFHLTNGYIASSRIWTDEQNTPDPVQHGGYWETRMFRLYAAAEKGKSIGDLLSVLVSTIQEMVVIKQLLIEKGVWDEELYKKLRTERMINDHSGAGATPWKSYSHFPYTLDEEEFLKHVFNAGKEEVEEFNDKVETASELT